MTRVRLYAAVVSALGAIIWAIAGSMAMASVMWLLAGVNYYFSVNPPEGE